MVAMWRVAILCMLLVAAVASHAKRLEAHPLHTTLADVQLDRRTGAIRVLVRVFEDDVDGAVAREHSTDAVTDARRIAYVSARLGLTDYQGRSISLQACGLNRRANLLWICLRGIAPASSSVGASDALLVDVYPDQVNLVEATDGHVKRTILFTRGDRAKPIL